VIQWFRDDESGYLDWIRTHPDGYVLNCGRHPTPRSLVLHKASCPFISGTPPPGNRWTIHYGKVCAGTITDIEQWASTTVGALPSRCRICSP
jgi:hypothetical protein